MRRRVSLLLAAAGAAVVVAGIGSAVVFGGVVNVAATDPEPAAVQWMLATTMKSSVRNHASDIVVPDDIDLRDPELAQRAFGHYSVACTPCHGGPGIASAPWLVLDPPARSLADTAAQWSDAELYWIVKHGIQMTGMPALGPTHEDADLWAIAAFVRQLPAMTPAQYGAMAQRHEAGLAEHGGHGMAPTPAARVEPTPAAAEPQTVPVIGESNDAPQVKPSARSRRGARSSRRTAATPPRAAEPEAQHGPAHVHHH